MSISVQALIYRVSTLLQDPKNTRWTIDELCSWVNDGARDLIALVPNANVKRVVFNLSPGPRQELPDDCFTLLDIPQNTDGGAIRLVNRKLLDNVAPRWYRQGKTSPVVTNFMYSTTEPDHFYVYPPQPINSPGSVDLIYSAFLEPVTPTGAIDLDSEYTTALVEYVLYRAYSKDAEYAANMQLASAHYQTFADALRGAAAVESQEVAKPS